MQYATYHNGSICIYATELKEKNNFFVTPFESSQLNIFESTAILNGDQYIPVLVNAKLYTLQEVQCKIFSLQIKNKFTYFPLLHTLDIKS